MKNEITENLTAVIHREDGMYVAECPEVGTVSQGKTVDDAIANLKEATELYLEGFPLKSKKRAIMTTFEVAVSGKASPIAAPKRNNPTLVFKNLLAIL